MAKRARERTRKAQQDAKRQRRQAAAHAAPDPEDGPDEAALMEEFRVLSERHAAGAISDAVHEQERQRIFDELGLETG